ncbi:hypothetical protein BXD15_00720 [Salmonella enterica subsp. enterica serovar Utah]|nr:hypothetical protein [Salmonella enterica subsp. enterica serovar Utah]
MIDAGSGKRTAGVAISAAGDLIKLDIRREKFQVTLFCESLSRSPRHSCGWLTNVVSYCCVCKIRRRDWNPEILVAAQCAFALFLCRAHGYASMVGRAGASRDAPVPTKAGSSNLVRFHHQ